MQLTVKEIEAKSVLIAAMEKHADKLSANGEGVLCYRFDEEVVILSDKKNVKVKRAVDDDDGEED